MGSCHLGNPFDVHWARKINGRDDLDWAPLKMNGQDDFGMLLTQQTHTSFCLSKETQPRRRQKSKRPRLKHFSINRLAWNGYHTKDKKKAKNKQNQARNGKDKVKSKPKSVKVKKINRKVNLVKVKSRPNEENTT
ncbi:hypothetical protein Tco_0468095 [Tanacetum coccineum]